MADKDTRRHPDREQLAQRCPVCGVRITRGEAAEFGRCADCVEGPR